MSHYAECHYVKCHNSVCSNGECHDAEYQNVIMLNVMMLNFITPNPTMKCVLGTVLLCCVSFCSMSWLLRINLFDDKMKEPDINNHKTGQILVEVILIKVRP